MKISRKIFSWNFKKWTWPFLRTFSEQLENHWESRGSVSCTSSENFKFFSKFCNVKSRGWGNKTSIFKNSSLLRFRDFRKKCLYFPPSLFWSSWDVWNHQNPTFKQLQTLKRNATNWIFKILTHPNYVLKKWLIKTQLPFSKNATNEN